MTKNVTLSKKLDEQLLFLHQNKAQKHTACLVRLRRGDSSLWQFTSIIDGWNYLFIHLSSPLLSFPPRLSAHFFTLEKRGQLGGKGGEASFISDVRGKNTGVGTIFVSGHTVDSRRWRVTDSISAEILSPLHSGSRCGLWTRPYNQRVWPQSGAAWTCEAGNVACWEH